MRSPALNYITLNPVQSWRWQPLRNQRCLRLCKIENPLRKSLRQRTFLGLSKKRTRHETSEWRREQAPALNLYYTKPCAIMALATFTKPAMFAPVQNRKSVKKKSAAADFFRIIEKNALATRLASGGESRRLR